MINLYQQEKIFKEEKIWLKYNNITSNQVSNFLKIDVNFMTDIEICFFIAEIDFITNETVRNEVIIDISDLESIFVPCENTILCTKNDDIETMVRIKLEPKRLKITSFPFEPMSKYELNIQLFMRKNI